MKTTVVTQPAKKGRDARARFEPIPMARNLTASVKTDSLLQPKPSCPCGGGCPRCQAPISLQPKLKINEPNDQYEQEADRVAEQVMRMPEGEIVDTSHGPAELRRKCAACAGGHELCPECEKDEVTSLQRASNESAPDNSVPPIVHEVLRSPGQPLDAATRTFMEPRFGRDFSDVRVHTDAKAVESAQAVNALAYTVGRDMVFDAGEYAPNNGGGQKLLAHELTHIVQQARGVKRLQRKPIANLGVEVPEAAEEFDPKHEYPWQNPHLRATIYPHRHKELMDFLLINKEIDLWKSARAGKLDLEEIATELAKERGLAESLFSEAKTEKAEAERKLEAHRRGRRAFFKQPDIVKIGGSKSSLERKKADLQKRIRRLESELQWYRAREPEHQRREKKEEELKALTIEMDETNKALEETTRKHEELVSPYASVEIELERRMKVTRERYSSLKSELEEIPGVSRRGKVGSDAAVRWELLKEKRRLENLDHDVLLQEVVKRFEAEAGRFPQWLQYMVIHFSGMRYQSAHGSWASPQELLKTLKSEELAEKMAGASEEAVAEQAKQAAASLAQQRQSKTSRQQLREIDETVAKLTGPKRVVEKAFAKSTKQKETFDRLRELRDQRDALAAEINEGGATDTTKDLNRSKLERLEQLESEIKNLEASLGQKTLERITGDLMAAERARRETVLRLQIKEAIARIEGLSDPQALGLLKAMRDQFPEWVWKEIVRHTQLRLEVSSADWENVTAEEKQEKSKKDLATKRWNEIMGAWQKNITLWRAKNRNDLSLVVIRAVCNEVAEHSQHARGVAPAPGITLKSSWYQEQEQKSPATSYFKRPTSAQDFRPGASIFWQIWAKERNSVANPIVGEDFLTENGRKVEDGLFEPDSGWTYHYDQEKKQFLRTSTGVCPYTRTSREDSEVVMMERLWWMHEATVVEVAALGSTDHVVTFETGAIGLRTRLLGPLLNRWNVFVGFVPAATPPASLEEKLKRIVPG